MCLLIVFCVRFSFLVVSVNELVWVVFLNVCNV